MQGDFVAMVLVLAIVFGLYGCSRESQDEIADRVSTARKALRGEIRSDNEEKVPRIVAEQRRKERFRQDTKWTPENQARHPIEYCQAQLEELRGYADSLDAQRYKCAVAKNKALRGISDAEAQLVDISKFLEASKTAYREADANGKWPVTIGGFALSKEKAQKKIVEAAERRPILHGVIIRNKNMITALERKTARIAEEQRKVVRIKEKTQLTLDGLKLKDVIDGDAGIADALNAINDALGSIGMDYDDPRIEELVVPDKATAIKETFDAIMAE